MPAVHLNVRSRGGAGKRVGSWSVKILLDRLVFAAGVAGPVMTLPQLIKIWQGKNAAGVSALSWGGYLASAIILFAYGALHKDRPIMVTYALWILFDSLIIAGALIYG